MKKTLSSLLILSTLAGLLAGCAQSAETPAQNGTETTQGNSEVQTETEAETTTEAEKLEVPTDMDYEGYEFKIYGYEHSAYIADHLAEELTGDLVNDSVYERNRSVEEMFNIKIKAIINPWDNDKCRTNVRKSVAAGDDSYDLLTGNTYNFTALSTEGMFTPIDDLTYIDVDKPWWNHSSYTELSVGDKAYLLMGDISLSNYGLMDCIFFNMDFVNSYEFENPYDYITNDTWTIDKMIEVTKDFYVDVDGNATSDEADLFGFYAAQSSVYDLPNNWIQIVEKDADNYPVVTFYNERTEKIFNKMRDYLNGSTGVYCPEGWTDIEYFMDGHSVFVYSSLRGTLSLRDMESDYGVLPVPKWDENQENYESKGKGLLVAVSATASDKDRSSMIIEALGYYGRKLVYPAYVETAIPQKGTRDLESQNSIEIILNNVTYDFGLSYSGFSGYGYAMLEYLRTNTDFASFYEKMSTQATAELDNYAQLILALN